VKRTDREEAGRVMGHAKTLEKTATYESHQAV
jgi:hypothetical protein